MFNSGAQDLTTGLKAHWTFDNTRLDQSGNGKHGTLKNGIGYGTDRSGDANSALHIVDNNDYFEFADITLNDLTVSFWINIHELPVSGSSTASNMNIISWGNGGGTRSRIHLNALARLNVENDIDGKNHSFGNSLSANEWYHVTFSRTGDAMSFYLNGEFISTSQVINAGPITLDRIGWQNSYRSFKGLIDEVHIYDRALDVASAKALYTETNPGLWSANGTVAYYPGQVAIGTNDPGSADLTVKGEIASKEVTVEISPGQGPDFVFEPSYELLSLEELQAYITKNKHLPEIPPASEMETNGVKLAEMNMKLLQKIEELTLYQLQLMKRFEAVEKRLIEIEER